MARQCAHGLMPAGYPKNMGRMAEVVPDAKSRNLQQFLAHSAWNERAVIHHVAHDAKKLIGDSESTGLIIDERSFPGNGWDGLAKLTGVKPQHSVSLQMADLFRRLMFGGIFQRNGSRIQSSGRERVSQKIERKFHTKIELALKIAEQARKNRLNGGWVVGQMPAMEKTLDSALFWPKSLRFSLSMFTLIFFVYSEDPCPYIPEKKQRERVLLESTEASMPLKGLARL